MMTLVTLPRRLVGDLRDAIRAEAAKITDFEEGAMVLSFVVKSEDANEFLGGFSDPEDSNVDIDFTYGIRRRSPKTRKNGFRGRTDGEVACRGYAILKIEGCAYAVRNNLGRRSCDMPDEAVAWGRENDRGAVCFDIMYDDADGEDNLFLRLYVAVSGASGEEDERCAMAAHRVLSIFADTESSVDRHWFILGPE